MVSASQVIGFLDDRATGWYGDTNLEVDRVESILPGSENALSFMVSGDSSAATQVAESLSTIVLVKQVVLADIEEIEGKCVIAVEEPRREYGRIVAEFFVPKVQAGIHPSAVVDSAATVAPTACICAGAVIEGNVSVGDRSWVGPNVTLMSGTSVGADCQIGPGTVIGHYGFGYSREDDGTPIVIPHLGKVRIGDRVEIGSNTSIDRGTIGDTVISDDAKIDNLVHIAHNCQIGKGAFVIATAIVSGSVRIGSRAWISPNASIREGLVVGEDSLVGLGAVVTRDVESGSVVLGNPAKPRT